MKATVYQQPDCPASPDLLMVIEQRGYQPITIDLMVEPPTRAQLVALLVGLQMTPRDILRKDVTLYDSLSLADPTLGDQELLTILSTHAVLIQGPILVTEKGIRLCLREDQALDIL